MRGGEELRAEGQKLLDIASHAADALDLFTDSTNPIDGDIPIDHFHGADMIVVGDPERCFEKMCHYADLGVDELICYVQFGYHSHESVMKTIELIGKEVLPEIEKYTPKPRTEVDA